MAATSELMRTMDTLKETQKTVESIANEIHNSKEKEQYLKAIVELSLSLNNLHEHVLSVNEEK